MSTNRDVTRNVRSWLNEDRHEDADRVLNAVLDQLDTTPQRRTMRGLPWRISPMPSSAKLALTAVAIAVVGFVGLTFLRGPVIGPAASPSPTASPSPVTQPPPPFTEGFDSPLHGISIDYPAGWETRPATEPWNHDAVAFGAPDVDVIFDPTLQDDLYFALASEPLGGRSADDWCCSELWASAEICSGGGGWGAYTLDGAHGFIGSCGNYFATVATATRGYVIVLHVGDDRLGATYDWGAWFEAALETVDLRPE